jgi:hypothetical protein
MKILENVIWIIIAVTIIMLLIPVMLLRFLDKGGERENI